MIILLSLLPHFADVQHPSQNLRRPPPTRCSGMSLQPVVAPSLRKTLHLKWPTDIKQQAPVGRVNLQYAPRGGSDMFAKPLPAPAAIQWTAGPTPSTMCVTYREAPPPLSYAASPGTALHWLLYIPPAVTFTKPVFCADSIFVC